MNTIVAESFSQFADYLENAEDIDKAVSHIIRREFRNHARIIFNGNGYDDAWVKEAEKRGLLNLQTTADAIPHYTAQKNIDLFSKHHIFTPLEVHSRQEILAELYCKTINIEALTMLEMAKKQLLPAAISFTGSLAQTLAAKKAIGMSVENDAAFLLADKLTKLTNAMYEKIDNLDKAVAGAKDVEEGQELAFYTRDEILTAMNELRAVADEIEVDMSEDFIPYPTYSDLLYSV